MAVFTAIASAIISVLSSTITFSAAFAAAGTLSALGIGVSVLAGGIRPNEAFPSELLQTLRYLISPIGLTARFL